MNRLNASALSLLAVVVGVVSGCASNESYATSDGYYADEGYDESGYLANAKSAPSVAGVSTAEPEADSGGGMFELFRSEDGASSRRVAQAPSAPPPADPQAVPAPAGPEEKPPVADDRAPEKRLMIYRADYTVMVANVDESVKRLIARAEGFGGYLQNRSDGTATVRVPAASFFELTKELAVFGTITRESLEAQDVTKQFVDLQLRIETAEKSRARLLELLSQATKMEDILSIEREVRRLTEEIETMKGGLRLLADQISFSTLTVRFVSNAPPPSPHVQRKVSRFPWIRAVGIERVLYDF